MADRTTGKQIRMNGGTFPRRGGAFTLVELLVVIGIIAILIAMLMPVLNKVRRSANTVACASNLRQIAMWGMMYASENNGYLPHRGDDVVANPTSPYWYELSRYDWPYKTAKLDTTNPSNPRVLAGGLYKGFGTASGSVLHCPQAVAALSVRTPASGYTYGLNAWLGGQTQPSAGVFAPRPKNKLLKPHTYWFGDARYITTTRDFHSVLNISTFISPSGNWPWNWWLTDVQTHPQQMNNFAFGDGHVEGVSRAQFMGMNDRQVKLFLGHPAAVQ